MTELRQQTIREPNPNQTASDAADREPVQKRPALGAAFSRGVDETVAAIVQLQMIRRHCIKAQSSCDRPIESLVAQVMGYRPQLAPGERKAIYRRAAVYRQAVEANKPAAHKIRDASGGALAPFESLVKLSSAARAHWDQRRKMAEADMATLAMKLPVWPFASTIRGLGPRALARIVGEAGIPLGDYRSFPGLWKRLGLAVIDGRAQRRIRGNPILAMVHGFSPARRAELWSIGDVMLRQQITREADERRAAGPYGCVYLRRRRRTERRMIETAHLPKEDPDKWPRARCHNDACRVMTKALIKDLWLVWRGHPPTDHFGNAGIAEASDEG